MKFSTSSAVMCAALLPGALATIFYAGVAQSSGEFGVWSADATPGTGLPGRFGTDYQFIDTKGVDIMIDQNKVNLHRVAFLLERMCPPADGLGAKFNETHFDYFKEAIDYITVTKGACALPSPFPSHAHPPWPPLTTPRCHPGPAQLHAV
jgi:hypothetical protein